MQLNLFPDEENAALIPVEELFKAYIACRKYKRGTANAIAFEIDYESNLVTLCEEINNNTYQPGKSIAFIFNKLNSLFEKEFINDSYACRIGKGTRFGIQRIVRFIPFFFIQTIY